MLSRVARALDYSVQMRKVRLNNLKQSSVFSEPVRAILEPRSDKLRNMDEKLVSAVKASIERSKNRLSVLDVAIKALDPSAVLERGYAIVEKADGLVTGIDDIDCGVQVKVRLSDGSFTADVSGKDAGGGTI